MTTPSEWDAEVDDLVRTFRTLIRTPAAQAVPPVLEAVLMLEQLEPHVDDRVLGRAYRALMREANQYGPTRMPPGPQEVTG